MLTSPHLAPVTARSVVTLSRGNLNATVGSKGSCIRNSRTSSGNSSQTVWFA